jgi:hypothetical protein
VRGVTFNTRGALRVPGLRGRPGRPPVRPTGLCCFEHAPLRAGRMLAVGGSSGALTFLFTDIEGTKRLVRGGHRSPARPRPSLARLPRGQSACDQQDPGTLRH